ncbi:MAG TPA: ATP-binding cassette domain-containing protein [Bacteroidia bacterium]|jgi:ABC-2 type transport system ATP-binding protein|nr:ATP-binding cassette domain-containing protein [Bacteroidia bacterium]
MNLLSVRNVTKRYANHIALSNVSIEVPEQSIFGLLGPNGAGKTSLIRIINQITGPDEGEILLSGKKLGEEDISHIGYLPEERGLYKKMKVGEQSLYLARLKGMSKADAMKELKVWFGKFEMGGWWNKKIEELSKGMQQKVQFIVTVIHKPKLLILDEPFSGFDPINAQLIRNEILDLRKNGTTVIFSTHNMGSVEELCDYIALINKSQKILDGSVKEIRKTYRSNTYDINFKGNMMGFTNAMWSGGELIEKHSDGDIHDVRVKLSGANKPNDLLKVVMPFAEINSLREVIPSMNDIFIMKVNEQQVMGTQSNYTE